MPVAAPVSPCLAAGSGRPRIARPGRRAFSLIEVILAIGILGVAVVALLGLIGPALETVRTVQETNQGINCISNLNALLSSAKFYDAEDLSGSVYTWVQSSQAQQPTIFLFYNEILDITTDKPQIVPRVVLFSNAVRVKLPGYMQMSDLTLAAQNGAINGPVIAMSISLSPLAQNFSPPLGSNAYPKGINPPNGYIFPNNGLPTNPDAANAQTGVQYPEGYLPILVQVFTLPLDQITIGASTFLPNQVLNESNRIFTYTTAKLR